MGILTGVSLVDHNSYALYCSLEHYTQTALKDALSTDKFVSAELTFRGQSCFIKTRLAGWRDVHIRPGLSEAILDMFHWARLKFILLVPTQVHSNLLSLSYGCRTMSLARSSLFHQMHC